MAAAETSHPQKANDQSTGGNTHASVVEGDNEPPDGGKAERCRKERVTQRTVQERNECLGDNGKDHSRAQGNHK